MKKSSNIILLFLFLVTSIVYTKELKKDKKVVLNYTVINQSIILNTKFYRLIRSFNIEGKKYFLAVDEETLKTIFLRAQKFQFYNPQTRYNTLLNDYNQFPYILQNDGVTSIDSTDKVYITTDLCPSSKKGYEEQFYKNLIKHYKKPVPITLFISGRWIKRHKQEFLELIKFQKEGKLDITWGNHTNNHRYKPKNDLSENFLLLPNTNIINEVIQLEKLLISNNITPSILFRFPGLISDENAILTIKKLGLIPIGSNTWLAKNQKIQKGSIILVHGNKNEPQGIQKAYQELFTSNYKLGSILEDLTILSTPKNYAEYLRQQEKDNIYDISKETSKNIQKISTTKIHSKDKYYIQIGSFKEEPNLIFTKLITDRGFNYIIRESSNGIKKLLIGPFNDKNSVKESLIVIKNKIMKEAYITK